MKSELALWLFVFLVGCASVQRDCASCNAGTLGADWIVLQYGFDGKPINCWKLKNVAVSNEENTDGIFWLESNGLHLVHISGWYNRVQVHENDFRGAANAIGIDMDKCFNGKYDQ